jgi:hypothetical protein
MRCALRSPSAATLEGPHIVNTITRACVIGFPNAAIKNACRKVIARSATGTAAPRETCRGPGRGLRRPQRLLTWVNFTRSLANSSKFSGSLDKPALATLTFFIGCRRINKTVYLTRRHF